MLSLRHVKQALGYEQRPEALGLVAVLWRAACAYVDEAERREASTARLPLELAATTTACSGGSWSGCARY